MKRTLLILIMISVILGSVIFIIYKNNQNDKEEVVEIFKEDTKEEADKYIRKMINLRIFEDENGKTNCSLKDVDGELLLVSQFTLYANCRKGNRPSFTQAGDPKKAEELYEYIINECSKEIDVVQTGIFGAHMEVALINDGPFTVVLEDL